MKLHPLRACMQRADTIVGTLGGEVFQQFLCAHCGTKHTIDEPNVFYAQGICSKCGKATNIEADGCNYAVAFSMRRKGEARWDNN